MPLKANIGAFEVKMAHSAISGLSRSQVTGNWRTLDAGVLEGLRNQQRTVSRGWINPPTE
jgi:hypothetical protein